MGRLGVVIEMRMRIGGHYAYLFSVRKGLQDEDVEYTFFNGDVVALDKSAAKILRILGDGRIGCWGLCGWES
jgi:hypothetical protein